MNKCNKCDFEVEKNSLYCSVHKCVDCLNKAIAFGEAGAFCKIHSLGKRKYCFVCKAQINNHPYYAYTSTDGYDVCLNNKCMPKLEKLIIRADRLIIKITDWVNCFNGINNE